MRETRFGSEGTDLLTVNHNHRRVDTYSFGVVLAEVMARTLPFSEIPRKDRIGFNSKFVSL